MRKLFLVLFSTALLVSCKPDRSEVQNNAPLPEQNLSNVAYGSDPAQKMDLYLPAGRSGDTTKLVIMVHGGAWLAGDKTDFNPFVSVLRQRFPNYAVANINYRLASAAANHFPAQEMDMKAAFDFLNQKSGEYHFSKNFILLGASAGGHLVLLQGYKYASPSIKAIIDFYGPTDMVGMYNDMVPNSVNQLGFQILLGGTPQSNPQQYQQSSPINFVTASAPPTLILHGTADDIVNISQSVLLNNKLQSLGVVHQMVSYPNEGHDIWPDPVMNDAYQKIETFLRANVH